MHRLVPAAAIIGLAATSASAYVNTMFQANNPASYGTLIQSLDIASTSWDFPFDTGTGKTNSGFKAEVLDPAGNPIVLDPGVTPNTTSLVSEVFRVDTTTVISDPAGDITLDPGDLVFSYRLRLVGANNNTVQTLTEFGVTALGPNLGGNPDIFDAALLKGRGFSTDGLGAPAASGPLAVGNDLTVAPGLFSSLDWRWSVDESQRLQNGEEVRLLMFSEPAQIGDGFAKFLGAPGQAVAGTDATAQGAPVLVPIIPSPGAAVLLGLAGLAAVGRRHK